MDFHKLNEYLDVISSYVKSDISTYSQEGIQKLREDFKGFALFLRENHYQISDSQRTQVVENVLEELIEKLQIYKDQKELKLRADGTENYEENMQILRELDLILNQAGGLKFHIHMNNYSEPEWKKASQYPEKFIS